MMTIELIQDEIIDEFSMFDDWMQKYEYMIDLGKSLPLISENNLRKGLTMAPPSTIKLRVTGSRRMEAVKPAADEPLPEV